MYEGNPMSFLIEQAGGIASTCRAPIMDVQPSEIHERVSIALGSREEVEALLSYHCKDQ
jgi:fructose-1,6-bisphosphatase I